MRVFSLPIAFVFVFASAAHAQSDVDDLAAEFEDFDDLDEPVDDAAADEVSADDTAADDTAADDTAADDTAADDTAAEGSADASVSDKTPAVPPPDAASAPPESAPPAPEASPRDPQVAPGDPPPVNEPNVQIIPPVAPASDPEPASEADAIEQAQQARGGRRLGDPVPLTRREPTLGSLGFEVNLHYGLVGTGPTRLTNDVRLGIFDWWELRTTFGPYPAGLMSRFKLGSQQGTFGALLIDGGLAAFDAGVRLVPEEGEAQAGIRFHLEGGLAYARALGNRFSIFAQARFRYRLSMLSKDDQNAFAGDVNLTYDLLDRLAITVGLGYAEVIGTPVRELAVNFVNTDRPGMSHFLLRDDGWSRSVTIPVALTYGRVDSFDVDVFITPRVWPQYDILFGAGLRWRIASLPKLVGLDW